MHGDVGSVYAHTEMKLAQDDMLCAEAANDLAQLQIG
jgi:hypothetical protein